MKSVIDIMHENAMRQSRAARLMRQATAIQEVTNDDASRAYESISKVIQLNNDAIEEFKKSARTMDFLLKYQPTPTPPKEYK